ncbi:class I adenylate-forming enzyme family protein [Oceanomicrobium pacificus]|uniref:AMP-binding protein n=1 Tax=Oceanomicrobium pacificus TaxID=2692916 RepID=A0A6B0TSU7_9RHOB|nr:AMP-binding protein [Oceanomicrobium pacificus]MXU65849.1 AMP-binding protein [Oceanomicrobium pacificus]
MPDPALFDDGPPPTCPARFNMAAYVLEAGRARPDHPALLTLAGPGQVALSLSHGALRRAVLETAAGLQAAGLARGDRIVLRLGNVPAFPILFYASLALGAVPVPLSAQLTASELAPMLDLIAPAMIAHGGDLPLPDHKALRVDADRLDHLRTCGTLAGFADTGADDPAYILFTSGTGGRPRAVLHAHRAAFARRMMWHDWYGLTPRDRMLHAGAFNWSYTLGTGLTDPWAAGATALIYTGPPDRAVWAALAAEHGATIFAAVPGVYRQLLKSGADCRAGFSALRHGLSAGEAMSPDLHRAWQDATGCRVHEALGMTEISTYVSGAPHRPAPTGTSGYPQAGRRIAILPETDADTASGARPAPVPRGTPGLLAVSTRDPGLMLGYLDEAGAPPRPADGDWFLTGDRAVMAEDGAITHLGRADDVLNVQGYRVSAREVELALAAHPQVEEVAVAALRRRADLDVMAAFIVPVAGSHPAPETLSDFLNDRLARYKQPREFILLDALPRSANGKILKRVLTDAHGWKG